MKVPDAEPVQPVDVYPLMINCNSFYVGGTSWSHQRERFLGSSMTGFLRSRFQWYLRREEFLNRFFYLKFDSSVMEEQKFHHKRSEGVGGRPSTSGLKDPKEEPVEDTTLDLENCQYSFYLCPRGGEV